MKCKRGSSEFFFGQQRLFIISLKLHISKSSPDLVFWFETNYIRQRLAAALAYIVRRIFFTFLIIEIAPEIGATSISKRLVRAQPLETQNKMAADVETSAQHNDWFVNEGRHFFTYPGNMGKEQDLAQAAKSGNVAHIERILGHKTRKSGIQRYVEAGNVWTGCSFTLTRDNIIHVFAV